MNLQTYGVIERYMLSCMDDSAHDKDHIYRVLYAAMDIAHTEAAVDYDVLICACLLHDIGRQEQNENPALCHAAVGAEKAVAFLVSAGFEREYAHRVGSCIRAHRFRTDATAGSMEAKILFDADKIDVTGTIGIARTILYNGQIADPLYSLWPDGSVCDGSGDAESSFFREYKYKLEHIYDKFYTERGAEIARERRASAKVFYESMLREVRSSYGLGRELLYHQLGDTSRKS